MKANKSSPNQAKRLTQSDLLQEQQTFDQLQETIANLQKQEKTLAQDFDGALQFYFENIRPIERAHAKLLIERTRIVYQFYKNCKGISHSEQSILKEWMWNDIMQELQVLTLSGVPEDVKNILKELNDLIKEEDIRRKIQEKFEELSRAPDYSGPHAKAEENSDPLSEKETPRAAEIEPEQSESKKIRKKSLHIIYRQLAKSLHPDLEPDREKKEEKEKLMKQLVDAYEKEDLHTLLLLEETWGNELNSAAQMNNCEQLQVYNDILDSQVKDLQAKIDSLWNSPKYAWLHRFYPQSFEGTLVLQRVRSELYVQREDLRQFVERLQTCAEPLIRQALQEKISPTNRNK